MPIFQSRVDRESDAFKKNRRDLLRLIDEVRTLEARVHDISASKKARFEKRGQLLPRERLALLLDPGASFVEFSTLAGLGQHDDDGKDNVFGAAVICGLGYVSGTRCMIYVNDAAIKGGTNMPHAYDKLKRAQDIAFVARLPFISLVQSGGANLFRQHLGFNRAGNRFMRQARSSAAGIPQITVVHGNATAGGAYVPGMSDYVIMVRDKSYAFLAGPPLLKAATGEVAEEEELGGALMHASQSGLAEFVADDDAHAIEIARNVVRQLKWNDRLPAQLNADVKPPRYDIDELCGLVPADYKQPYDCRETIARIVDDSDFTEFKALYDPYTICCFAEIGGHACGIIGNNGPIDNAGAEKATQFIQLCCQAEKPIIYFQNTTGFIVGKDPEARGMIKNGAKMIQAVSNATVPQITFLTGASFGAGNYAMCGRSFRPRFLFAWPNSTLAVMGGEQAATVMSIVYEAKQRVRGEPVDESFVENQSKEIKEYYDEVSTALFSTSQVWDEGIIDPRKTRGLLIELLDVCIRCEKTRLSGNTFGVARG
ncbi:MAG: acyl-CoA carboxylase subunit beta [Alphaproteobacteria bacterium]